MGPKKVVTTLALGEEDRPSLPEDAERAVYTTLAIGEEDGVAARAVTTMAVGEEGGDDPTTLAIGEEDGTRSRRSGSDPFGDF